jgi:large subunit ribosomal protein L9
MSQKVKIILLEDVSSLGQAGDIISVNDGYARNFLFPQGKAALASEGAISKHQQKAKAKQKKTEKNFEALKNKAEALDGTELTISARLKENEDIYGKITTTQIAKELSSQASHQFKPRDINLAQSITSLGTYPVTIKLGPDIEAQIQVTVVAKKDNS